MKRSVLWLVVAMVAANSESATAQAEEGPLPLAFRDAWTSCESPYLSSGRIAEVADGGTTILLDNGSVWDVYLPDRPTTFAWDPGQFVQIERVPAPTENYEFWLESGSEDRAAARFAGCVEPGQLPDTDPADDDPTDQPSGELGPADPDAP